MLWLLYLKIKPRHTNQVFSPKWLQVKIQGQNEEMLLAACEQFLGKSEEGIQQVALETLEGHQRAIMGSMTVEVSKQW